MAFVSGGAAENLITTLGRTYFQSGSALSSAGALTAMALGWMLALGGKEC